jgi:hypothetical protein
LAVASVTAPAAIAGDARERQVVLGAAFMARTADISLPCSASTMQCSAAGAQHLASGTRRPAPASAFVAEVDLQDHRIRRALLTNTGQRKAGPRPARW